MLHPQTRAAATQLAGAFGMRQVRVNAAGDFISVAIPNDTVEARVERRTDTGFDIWLVDFDRDGGVREEALFQGPVSVSSITRAVTNAFKLVERP